mmetsp:Transcript_54397/g.69923  ORF Transcript_54397/g.69923 Transcript_54397/m.69923 type:complete len:264 (+) Transcript_54397:18-809(+)
MASLSSKQKPETLKRKQTDLFDHFNEKNSKKKSQILDKFEVLNEQAEKLANSIAISSSKDAKIIYLTKTGESWIVLVRGFLPSPSKEVFNEQWALHPQVYHKLKVFGKIVSERRYSQSWGYSYKYSGSVNHARSIDDSPFVQVLINTANDLVGGRPYNGCLQNWYEPEHYIGLHSDDEKRLQLGVPIFSLTWGGTRRFTFHPRSEKSDLSISKTNEFWLHDGDLVIMGGTTQQTHKHEIPKFRITKDEKTSKRINWTIRAFLK